MSIAVSVLTTSCVARNNGGAARQETTRGSSPEVIETTFTEGKISVAKRSSPKLKQPAIPNGI